LVGAAPKRKDVLSSRRRHRNLQPEGGQFTMTDKPLAATLIVDRERGTRRYDPMIFGHFIEHFHTQVYGGLFWPGHALSDDRGFRRDVIDAMRELKVPVMRWPGGNFVSDYHWYDAVGPQRQASFNMAWQVPEPNSFGTDEFIAWCREVGCEPYICTNGGNGGQQEMSDWVEYCNGGLSTRHAERRRANGQADPHGVRYWGIGNESYGDWQIGAKTIGEWGRYVAESAKMMRRVDPSIVLSAAALPDLDWTLALLRAAGRYLDLVSIHDYWDPLWQKDEPRGYLDAILQSEKPGKLIADTRQILGVAGFADRIRIAFDEWNLRGWHHPPGNTPEALAARDRNDIASTYTMADAIFSASFLNACLRNADIVQMANISPTVNTRGPLFVHDSGIVRRTTFHVMAMYANRLLPELADAFVKSDRIGPTGNDVAAFDAVASTDGISGPLALMLVNRDPERSLELTARIDGQPVSGAFDALRLSGDSPDAFNSVDTPERVTPQKTHVDFADGRLTLPPHTVLWVRIG
jgi:alpha-N-arabinofuranosidase